MILNPCYKADGIYVEHGNEYDESNRFPSQEAPFISKKWLQTSFGSTFMSRFYNRVETQTPFIDNLYPELAAAFWALRYQSILSSLPRALEFAAMLAVSQTSLKNLDFVTSQLALPETKEDIPPKTVENLLKIYDNIDPTVGKQFRSILQDPANASRAAEIMTTITDENWQSLYATLGSNPDSLKVVLDIDPYVEASRRIVVKNPDVDIVIMGHTHEVGRTDITKLQGVGSESKWYVNAGAWQKTAAVKEARGKIGWSKLDLDDASIFPEHFSYVVVTYDSSQKPSVLRKFWPR